MQIIWDSQDNLKEQSWRTNTPNTKTYYKAVVIKTRWYWHKDEQTGGTEQRIWKQTHNKYSYVIYDKGDTAVQQGR